MRNPEMEILISQYRDLPDVGRFISLLRRRDGWLRAYYKLEKAPEIRDFIRRELTCKHQNFGGCPLCFAEKMGISVFLLQIDKRVKNKFGPNPFNLPMVSLYPEKNWKEGTIEALIIFGFAALPREISVIELRALNAAWLNLDWELVSNVPNEEIALIECRPEDIDNGSLYSFSRVEPEFFQPPMLKPGYITACKNCRLVHSGDWGTQKHCSDCGGLCLPLGKGEQG